MTLKPSALIFAVVFSCVIAARTFVSDEFNVPFTTCKSAIDVRAFVMLAFNVPFAATTERLRSRK